jgi:hypothetical protein
MAESESKTQKKRDLDTIIDDSIRDNKELLKKLAKL